MPSFSSLFPLTRCTQVGVWSPTVHLPVSHRAPPTFGLPRLNSTVLLSLLGWLEPFKLLEESVTGAPPKASSQPRVQRVHQSIPEHACSILTEGALFGTFLGIEVLFFLLQNEQTFNKRWSLAIIPWSYHKVNRPNRQGIHLSSLRTAKTKDSL